MSTSDYDHIQRPTALITGGSKGIGFEMAKQFAAHRHELVMVARSETALQNAAGDLKNEYGSNVTIFRLDLTTEDTPEALFRRVEAKGIRVDVLVNDAV